MGSKSHYANELWEMEGHASRSVGLSSSLSSSETISFSAAESLFPQCEYALLPSENFAPSVWKRKAGKFRHRVNRLDSALAVSQGITLEGTQGKVEDF